MRSDLRERIHHSAEVESAKLIQRQSKVATGLGDARVLDRDDHAKLLAYDNRQLKHELIPAYREMAKLFREKFSLADPETCAYYPDA